VEEQGSGWIFIPNPWDVFAKIAQTLEWGEMDSPLHQQPETEDAVTERKIYFF
jgi:hypothetical protein